VNLPQNPTFRGMITGFPKVGKTGSLVALASAGYKIIYCDFDHNPETLVAFAGDAIDNFVYLPFEDKIRLTGTAGRLAGVSGEPKAYFRFMEFLERGVYISPDGATKETHGAMTSWGRDTILVLDSMTQLVDAIWRRFLHTVGRTARTKRDWGAIVEELALVVQMMTSARLTCHSITIAHLQLVDAGELEEADKKGDRQELIVHNNRLRQEKLELMSTHLFPIAVTKAQSMRIAGLFPCILPVEVSAEGRRQFNLTPRKEIEVALPASAAKLKKTLPIETGLLDIFKAVTGDK
jgi:hypothetical protein